MGCFSNEDFADYVVGISIMYQKGEIKVNAKQLTEIINHYYYKYCECHHLIPQPLVPIHSIQQMILPQL